MDFFLEYRPVWAILISLLAARLIFFAKDRPNLREAWTLFAAFIKFGLVVSMVPKILDGDTLEISLMHLSPEISLFLRVDPLGLVFALVASFLWILTSIYSIGYMRAGKYQNQTGYFASFAVCLSSTIGIAFAGNLLTFFIFYEMLTIATYPLVIHNRNEEAIRAGRKYLGYTLIAGQLLLVGIILIEVIAPGHSFRAGGFLPFYDSPYLLQLIFALMILGVGVKAGLMPLHGWLPAAMVAPTPVSALLHAVAVVKAGVFGVLRITGFVFGPELLAILHLDIVLATAASITIIVASVRALGETHFKRRLAYSTVSQLSYIILGAAIGNVIAFAGAIFHVAAHAFMKITLFFTAGAIYTRYHKDDIADFGGIGRKMPITLLAFSICALGMAGIPFLPGFVSKWNIGFGAFEAHRGVFAFVLILSGLLNFGYFIPIIRKSFWEGPKDEIPVGEAPKSLWIPLTCTAIIAVLLGCMPDIWVGFFELSWMAALDVFSL